MTAMKRIILLTIAAVLCFTDFSYGGMLRVPHIDLQRVKEARKSEVKVVGVPKEVKEGETRVGLTDKEVRELTEKGVVVLIEKGAGEKSNISDMAFKAAGAVIVDSAAEVWEKADIIKKIKEPLPQEYSYLREGLIVFTYFHLANPENKELTEKLIESGVTAIAYETILDENGTTFLLVPMSRVAGWVAGIWAAVYRNTDNSYSEYIDNKTHLIKWNVVDKANERVKRFHNEIIGAENLKNLKASDFNFSEDVLLQIPKGGPGNVLILGGGHVGRESAYMSLITGSKSIVITEVGSERRKELTDFFRLKGYGNRVKVIDPGKDPENPTKELRMLMEEADTIIGGVYIRSEKGSATAPLLISEKLLEEISHKKKKIIIDVACDQGGNIAPALTEGYNDLYEHPTTTHEFPARLDTFGNLRIAVMNMPAAFGEIASAFLDEATQPLLVALSSGEPFDEILSKQPEIESGICVREGFILDREAAETHDIATTLTKPTSFFSDRFSREELRNSL